MRERSNMTRIDLHVHSGASGDNDADPEEIVERAIELGLDGIAFTEHTSYGLSEHVERLREKYGAVILLLRGVELSAIEGHCLVFGVDTDALDLRSAPVREVVRVVGESGGVVIPSHPFRGGNSLGDRVFDLPGIGGLEGYNGANMHGMNEKALEAARKLRLPVTGGSDAHRPREVGSCYTEFQERITAENILSALKGGRFRGVDTRKISRSLLLP